MDQKSGGFNFEETTNSCDPDIILRLGVGYPLRYWTYELPAIIYIFTRRREF
jgi:hypothetical protein